MLYPKIARESDGAVLLPQCHVKEHHSRRMHSLSLTGHGITLHLKIVRLSVSGLKYHVKNLILHLEENAVTRDCSKPSLLLTGPNLMLS